MKNELLPPLHMSIYAVDMTPRDARWQMTYILVECEDSCTFVTQSSINFDNMLASVVCLDDVS